MWRRFQGVKSIERGGQDEDYYIGSERGIVTEWLGVKESLRRQDDVGFGSGHRKGGNKSRKTSIWFYKEGRNLLEKDESAQLLTEIERKINGARPQSRRRISEQRGGDLNRKGKKYNGSARCDGVGGGTGFMSKGTLRVSPTGRRGGARLHVS